MEWTIAEEARGQRLDHYLQARLPEFSRSRLQDWIRAGRIRINAGETKASFTLRGGEHVSVEPAAPPPLRAEAEDIPVTVLYEDESVIAIDKPAGMVVHAGAGNHSGTLVNALLHRFGRLSQTGGELRPGIVHRIDKETSGVLIVARDDAAHRQLAAQFQDRTVDKRYLAVVHGQPSATGKLLLPIARDAHRRTRMTCKTATGRTAHTEWTVRTRFARHALLEVHIFTGRTHQIRVHMAAAGHPILGDTLYGAPATTLLAGRFFLHAWRLAFTSPATGERVNIESPLPADLVAIIESEQL